MSLMHETLPTIARLATVGIGIGVLHIFPLFVIGKDKFSKIYSFHFLISVNARDTIFKCLELSSALCPRTHTTTSYYQTYGTRVPAREVYKH